MTLVCRSAVAHGLGENNQTGLKIGSRFLPRAELFHMKPKSLCINEAVITNDHIE
jgi:hypothetical protein